MMKRLVLAPYSAFFAGMIMTAIIALAVFAFGAPPWILVPVTWGGITIYAEMCSRAEGQVDQRGDS
jgi:hypothetical protein